MINTITYTNKNFPIASERIFERLFNLEEVLDGQSVKIKSIFNPADNDPSMILFYSEENIYRFKDFSTGKYGDAADVVGFMFNIPDRQQAFRKILELFKDASGIITTTQSTFTRITKEVTAYKIRTWNKMDEEYWKQYYIGGFFLKTYIIKPLSEYTMTITKGSVSDSLTFNGACCYGFFNKYGELCKIYNPKNAKAKYLKVKEFIQGEDQLTYTSKCLIIASGLKDIGSFKAMKFPDIELVAPDSENVKIPLERINYYKSKYQYIFTMFDNDMAGMKAMKEYKDLYDIPFLYFTVENDIADCLKEHGPANSKLFFKPVLKNAIQKENKRINNQQ